MNRQWTEICYGSQLTVILQYCDVSGGGVQQHSRHWGGSLEGHVKAFVSFHYVVVKYPNLDKLHWLKCAELHRRDRGGEVNTTWEVFKIVGRLAKGIHRYNIYTSGNPIDIPHYRQVSYNINHNTIYAAVGLCIPLTILPCTCIS